jgi:hypothetical protein
MMQCVNSEWYLGGNIGKFSKGGLEPEFEEEAFKMPSFEDHKGLEQDYPYGKCKTIWGYHIIVVRKKNY